LKCKIKQHRMWVHLKVSVQREDAHIYYDINIWSLALLPNFKCKISRIIIWGILKRFVISDNTQKWISRKKSWIKNNNLPKTGLKILGYVLKPKERNNTLSEFFTPELIYFSLCKKICIKYIWIIRSKLNVRNRSQFLLANMWITCLY